MGIKILLTMLSLILLYLLLKNSAAANSILGTLGTVSTSEESALQGR